MLIHLSRGQWACAITVLCAAVSFEVPANVADAAAKPINLHDAVSRALESNPGLHGARYALRAREAEQGSAVLKPAPAVSLQVEDAFGTGSARGTERAQWTLSLSQVVELGGRAGYRRGAAEARTAVTQVQRDARQLDLLAEVARAYVDLLAAQARHDLALDTLSLARKAHGEIRERVAAARSPEFHRRRTAVDVARAELALEHAEHAWDVSSRQLAASWGEIDAGRLQAVGVLMQPPTIMAFDRLQARLDQQPELLHFVSEARLRDAEWQLARSRGRPELEWNLGARQLPGGDDQALVAGVSIPLFSARRARPKVEAADWRREQSRQDAQQARLQLSTRLFAIYQELRHALRELDALESVILPELEAVVAQTRDGLRRGRFSYYEWADAQRELLASRRARIDAAHEAHLHAIELERLTGVALSPAAAVQSLQEPQS